MDTDATATYYITAPWVLGEEVIRKAMNAYTNGDAHESPFSDEIEVDGYTIKIELACAAPKLTGRWIVGTLPGEGVATTRDPNDHKLFDPLQDGRALHEALVAFETASGDAKLEAMNHLAGMLREAMVLPTAS